MRSKFNALRHFFCPFRLCWYSFIKILNSYSLCISFINPFLLKAVVILVTGNKRYSVEFLRNIHTEAIMQNKNELLSALENCVVEMEDEQVLTVANDYVNAGYDAYEGIEMGLCKGMERVGVLFDEEEYYIPELLLCSDTMYAGIEILQSHIDSENAVAPLKAVVGVVEGDTHDIGKNIFKIMLQSNGFEVHDLGRDVPCTQFVEKAKEIGAHLIGMSTLMTTTMENMEKVIELLKQESLRDDVVVMVGGGPVSRNFSETIGADGYEREASTAAKLAKRLVTEKMGLTNAS